MPGLARVQDGHAVDRSTLGSVGGGVHHVARADDHSRVAVLELAVDGVHLIELVVGDVHLAKQDVHVTGHTARHGMNGELDLAAASFELVGKLLDLRLCLCQRHAVAGNNHNLLCVGQNLAGISSLGRGRRFCSLGCGGCLGRGGLGSGGRAGLGGLGSRTEENAGELAVHGPAHHLRQQQTGRTDDAADRDQHQILNSDTGNAAGHAGQGVQQGDCDGHIRAADPDGKCHAEEGGQKGRHDVEHSAVQFNTRNARSNRCNQRHDDNGGVTLPDHGALIQQLRQLAGCDHGAGEGDKANHKGEYGNVFGSGVVCLNHRENGDQRAGQTAQTVEEGDDLRHLNHLDLGGTDQAEHSANGNGDPNDGSGENLVLVHRDQNCNDRAERRKGVAVAGGLNLAHHADADENAQHHHSRDDVICGGGECYCHVLLSLPFRFFVLKHTKHTTGNAEAARDVDHRHDDSKAAHNRTHGSVDLLERHGGYSQRAEDGDAGQRVHAGHQRSVQQSRHPADNQVAHNAGHKENENQSPLRHGSFSLRR